MIIVKAPLRISICGGGTDLPSYYEQFGSFFISAAIDKYIYISLHNVFDDQFLIKYSETEKVDDITKIKHPLIREAFQFTDFNKPIELCSFADIPAGTGLGSSGTFTVAILKAIHTYKRNMRNNLEIAEEACLLEIEKLKSPIGKQDQYIAAVGGISQFEIDKTGKVTASPFSLSDDIRVELEENLLLFFTGYSRSASSILKEQDDKTKIESQGGSSAQKSMIENLHFVQELAYQMKTALERGQLNEFASLMNVHWEFKKKRTEKMTNTVIDDLYALAMANGALGGKLIGAGGGGFLMFLAEDKRKLRKAMSQAGLKEVPFRFDKLGAQVVLND